MKTQPLHHQSTSMNGTRSVYFESSPSQSHSDRDYHRWKSTCRIRSVGGIARHCSSTANRTPLIFVAHIQFTESSATSEKAPIRYVKSLIECWIEKILEPRREDRGVYIRYECFTASDIIGRPKVARRFGGLKDQIGGRGCVRRL